MILDFDFVDPRFTARPSPVRRGIGVGVQVALGLILLYVGFTAPPQVLFWQVFLIGLGALSLLAASRSWQATSGAVVLRADGLWTDDGQPIAPLDDISKVDRALFTMKPSNGFLLFTRTALGRRWVPGMWWRVGRRVGIGGMLPGAQAKLFSDTLAAMVDARDNAPD